jgi:hypothetical protein
LAGAFAEPLTAAFARGFAEPLFFASCFGAGRFAPAAFRVRLGFFLVAIAVVSGDTLPRNDGQ